MEVLESSTLTWGEGQAPLTRPRQAANARGAAGKAIRGDLPPRGVRHRVDQPQGAHQHHGRAQSSTAQPEHRERADERAGRWEQAVRAMPRERGNHQRGAREQEERRALELPRPILQSERACLASGAKGAEGCCRR